MTEQNTRFLSGSKISIADMALISSNQLAVEIYFNSENVVSLQNIRRWYKRMFDFPEVA
jgi:glutathione S-transferase